MAEAFHRLHRSIQEPLFDQKWEKLKQLQVDTITAVFDTTDHLILSAATASGKTEAAFLPILSRIAERPSSSVQALYVGPLKALINDQFRRLEDLCRYAEIPVHRWHGDVSATAKQALLRQPDGVLLITPESLESQFINRPRELSRLYSGLQFVVIDELHAFLDNVRGMHLRSLLARLNIAVQIEPRILGLSATLGDDAFAKNFLCPDDPTRVKVIHDNQEGKTLPIKIGLKAFFGDDDAGRQEDDDESPVVSSSEHGGLPAIAADLAERFRGDTNLIFCNSRTQTELLADDLRKYAKANHWPADPFFVHHGSLSKEIRDEAEGNLKAGRPVTAVCTSTLEMGIDIGSVMAVGQVGPAWSVGSLAQRVGRSGRRPGTIRTLRHYTLDRVAAPDATLQTRLYPNLVRSIAMIQLLCERWIEPPQGDRFHFSTCVHQILSILRQTAGIHAAGLFDLLCRKGPFRQIESGHFSTLLRGLSEHELIEQVPTGELILAPDGERIVQSRDFYSVFASNIEYLVESKGEPIGTLALELIPEKNGFLLFAGRRWQLQEIDHPGKRALVVPAKRWQKPRFLGKGGIMHDIVVARMRDILAGNDVPTFLAGHSSSFLERARQSFREAGLRENPLIIRTGQVEWFPWRGTRTLETLELCAKQDGLKTEVEGLMVRYHCSEADFLRHCQTIMEGAFKPADLASHIGETISDRFDEYVPKTLLLENAQREKVSLEGALACAGELLMTMR